jgi:hypothetical protein
MVKKKQFGPGTDRSAQARRDAGARKLVDVRTDNDEHATQSAWVWDVVGGGHRQISL